MLLNDIKHDMSRTVEMEVILINYYSCDIHQRYHLNTKPSKHSNTYQNQVF